MAEAAARRGLRAGASGPVEGRWDLVTLAVEGPGELGVDLPFAALALQTLAAGLGFIPEGKPA